MLERWERSPRDHCYCPTVNTSAVAALTIPLEHQLQISGLGNELRNKV